MQGERYRIVATTFAFRSIDGRRITVQVPIDAVVTLDGPVDGNRLVDVVWRDSDFMMFTQDLRQRAEPIASRQLLLPFTYDASGDERLKSEEKIPELQLQVGGPNHHGATAVPLLLRSAAEGA